jgi:hypothetical protein
MPATDRQVSQPARETLLLAGLAVAGVVVVLLILFADRVLGTPGWVGYTPDRNAALKEPGWSLWVVLVVGQGALWGVLLPLLLSAHARLRVEVSVRDLVATLSPLIVLSAVIDVVRYTAQVKSPLPGHFGKVTVVTWVGTLVALVAVAGIVRVGRAAWSLEVVGRGAPALEEYLELRSRLRQFLLIAGAVVGGAVLAAGALANAIDGYRGQMGRPESALVYGLFLSTLLAAVYAPAFAALRGAGERVLEELEPSLEPGDDGWPLGTPRRRELRAHLELDAGLVESLRVGVAVLAPLASGLVSLLLSG